MPRDFGFEILFGLELLEVLHEGLGLPKRAIVHCVRLLLLMSSINAGVGVLCSVWA